MENDISVQDDLEKRLSAFRQTHQGWNVRIFNPDSDALEEVSSEDNIELALFVKGELSTTRRLNTKTLIHSNLTLHFIGGLGNEHDLYVIQEVDTPDGEKLAAIWVIENADVNEP